MKLLVALFAFIAISASAFATDNYKGAPQDVSVTLTTNVIKMLSQNGQSDVLSLPALVAGTRREFAPGTQVLPFDIDGEASKGVTITPGTFTCPETGFVLEGSFPTTLPTALGTDGKLTVNYTVTAVEAPVGFHGQATFSGSITVTYTTL